MDEQSDGQKYRQVDDPTDGYMWHFQLGDFFLFSGSRESLPFFSENPNKNKSVFAEFYFYFPPPTALFCQKLNKNDILDKKNNILYIVLNQFYIARRTRKLFIHSC